MSRILPCAACLVVITVSLTSGQQVVGNQEAGISRRQGLSRGAQNAEERGNLLQAQERDALSEQALLNREMRRQARIDRKAERRERKQERLARKEEARLKAQSATDFETFDEAAEFRNLDAAADKSSANKFGLSIISEDVANEKAAISQSSGSKANSGTRFEESQFINAEELFEEQVEANEAVEDGQLLSAANADEDLFKAEEALNRENEAQINAQNSFQANNIFQDNGFAGQQGAFGGGFGAQQGGGGGFGNNFVFGNGNANGGGRQGFFGNNLFGGRR